MGCVGAQGHGSQGESEPQIALLLCCSLARLTGEQCFDLSDFQPRSAADAPQASGFGQQLSALGNLSAQNQSVAARA